MKCSIKLSLEDQRAELTDQNVHPLRPRPIMKRRKNRRRNHNSKLGFQRLEARQLLAGDVLGSHQAAGSIPTGANLVANGDFETVTAGADNFYTESEVTGWLAKGASTGQELNIFDYNSSFDNVLDLDSRTRDFDRVYQDINTEASTQYLISFDYSIHPTADENATDNTHAFEIWWNGEQLGTYTGASYWQTGVFEVTSSDAATTELLFCEVQEGAFNGGDGRGALLDNIRVVKANEVTVNNGSFETNSTEKNLFYRPYEVENWGAMGADVNDRWVKIVEQDGTSATNGTQYLNLDATETTRDMVFTDLATTAGATYYVTFDMRTDGASSASDELRVRWNAPLTTAGTGAEWAGTIIGNDSWQTYGLVLTAETAETRLTFLEPGDTTGDGSGPLIDNLRMFEIEATTTSDTTLSVDANGSSEGTTAAATFIPVVGAQTVAENLVLSHAETDGNLTSVTVELEDVVDASNEILGISTSSIPLDGSNNPIITNAGYDSDTRQLVLTGTATADQYQQVLRSLTYYNAAEVVSTSARNIKVTINDSTQPADSQSAIGNIQLNIETDQAVIDDAVIQKYMADNGITAEQDGALYYVIHDPGTGLNPTINSTVNVDYTGNTIVLDAQNDLVKGPVFETNDGAEFPISGVIAGWRIGVPKLKSGGSATLLIPSSLAYGSTGNSEGDFQNTVLLFDVTLNQILT